MEEENVGQVNFNHCTVSKERKYILLLEFLDACHNEGTENMVQIVIFYICTPKGMHPCRIFPSAHPPSHSLFIDRVGHDT